MGVPEGWEEKSAEVKAYIDDINIIEKVRHVDSISEITVHKQKTKCHAPKSEAYFKHVSKRAEEMNMRVNESNTQMLCISAASASDVKTYVNTKNSRIESDTSLKILGFWFGEKPGVELHVSKLEMKFRGCLLYTSPSPRDS